MGKTIQAGLLIRQAWLARIAKRILILAPKAVLTQWQIELREKFNLNVPIYDGKTLTWYDCPALRVLGKPLIKPASREEWHKEPIVITSSQLMRRADRARELINEAEPYDLVFLDEAHHARRQGVSGTQPKGANQLRDKRRAAIAIMRFNTPVNRLISRHTRELLRRYYDAGKMSSRIATRIVEDEFVSLTAAERQLYEAVEDYISSTYNNASQADKNAVGFVMTIYRRRLASSFAALEHTLSQRSNILKNQV